MINTADNPFHRYIKKYGVPNWEVNYTGGFAIYANAKGKGRIDIVADGFRCDITPNKGRKPVIKTFKSVNGAIGHVMHKLSTV